MLKEGQKYIITGIHKSDAHTDTRKKLVGATAYAKTGCERYSAKNPNGPTNYYHGDFYVPSTQHQHFYFYAVYLKKVRQPSP